MQEHTKDLFRRKLENIHSNLMEGYRDSGFYSSPVVGAEREAVKKELLSLILPPGYRIGSGTIVDADGRETGQIDAIIEQPFSLSFPVATDTNRLYLADSVGAAFEIKSDLNSQKKDALEKIREIRKLRKFEIKHESDECVNYGEYIIPSFIIAYKGPKSLEQLQKDYISPTISTAPNGVLVIESALYCGEDPDGRLVEAQGSSMCMLAFLDSLLRSLQFTVRNEIDLFRYRSLLNKK